MSSNANDYLGSVSFDNEYERANDYLGIPPENKKVEPTNDYLGNISESSRSVADSYLGTPIESNKNSPADNYLGTVINNNGFTFNQQSKTDDSQAMEYVPFNIDNMSKEELLSLKENVLASSEEQEKKSGYGR